MSARSFIIKMPLIEEAEKMLDIVLNMSTLKIKHKFSKCLLQIH